MSAYSEWKHGLLTDEEYRQYMTEEARRDEYLFSLECSETNDCGDDELT